MLFSTKDLAFENLIRYPDLEIPQGVRTFVVGESGAGKSTLLKLFNRTLPFSAGKISYRWKDILTYDTLALRKQVCLVGQEAFLFGGTIRENFDKFYAFREMPAPDDGQIQKMLSVCCLSFSPDKDCAEMSGGERQRMALAVCLSFSPKVLLLDEPTSALDGKTAASLMENLCAFCGETGADMVAVSHDANLTKAFGQNIITLYRGDGR